MDSISRFFRKEEPARRKRDFGWLYDFEYQLVMVLATSGFIICSFYLYLVIVRHFYGVMDKTSFDYNELDPETYTMPHRLTRANYHAVLCGTVAPVCLGNGVIMFRLWCCYSHTCVKYLHAVVLSIPVVPVFLSISYVKDWGTYLYPPQYISSSWTLHTWLGYGFVFTFVISLLSGLIVYVVLPVINNIKTAIFREKFVPYHYSVGVAYFLVGIACIITGWTEYMDSIFADAVLPPELQNVTHVKLHSLRHMHGRCLTLTYVMSTFPVMYALAREDFRTRGRIVLTRDRPMHFRQTAI